MEEVCKNNHEKLRRIFVAEEPSQCRNPVTSSLKVKPDNFM